MNPLLHSAPRDHLQRLDCLVDIVTEWLRGDITVTACDRSMAGISEFDRQRVVMAAQARVRRMDGAR